MAGFLRERFRKTTVRDVGHEVVGRHRADTREAPLTAAEPVAVGAHMKVPEPSDG